jgi:hypothetical protein
VKRGTLCTAPLSLLFFVLSLPAQAQVSFSQPPTYAGSGQLFVADFDGKPGILAANGTLNLGNGDGTFKSGTAVTGSPLAVADFNGDGKPDVLELGTGTLRVLLGNGDGTFQAPIITNSGAGLTVVGATDLNGDGKADVVGIFNNTLFVYLANGDGTFAAGVSYSLGAVQIYLPTILFGDFNGDHKTDVAVLTSPQEIVLLGNGDGTFQSTVLTSTGAANTTSVVVGDFNGDGRLDLAATLAPTNGAVTVVLQFGNGDGTFQAATTAFSGPASNIGQLAPLTALAAADVSGDGKLDLVLAADLIGIYLGNGDGTFSNTPIYYQPLSSGNAGIAIADFNSDGKPDIAADDEILLGNGNGKFQGPPTTLLPGCGVFAVGKFVKNGAPGVAMADGTSVCILTNDGTGLLSLAHTYNLPQGGLGGLAIATADVNGDSNLDLIVTGVDPTSANWGYNVLLGNGDGSFQPPVWHQENVGGQVGTIVIADFNNDHKLDLAVQAGTQTFALLLGNGDGTFASPAYVFDGDGGNFVSADFNGDGNLDIAEAGPSGLAIVLGNGDGTFRAAAFPSPTLNNSGIRRAVDLNGDGKVDLIFDGIQVLLGNGDGTFNALPVQNLGSGMNLFSDLYDFNGDGKPDVIASAAVLGVSYDFRINGVFLGKGDGTFNPSEIPIAYQSPVVQAIDMNGDGRADLIMQSNPYVAATVFVLLNTTVTPAPDFTVAPASGSPISQTISAGQKATFNLSFAAVGGFSGSVGLTCGISPTVTPPPTCSLPSSVQIGTAVQTVTVTVATTAPVTTSALPAIGFPPPGIPLAWTALMLGSGWLFLRNRKRLPGLAAPVIVLAFATWVGCGGGPSSSHHTTPGTPAGTYTATITATSGSISHSMPLTVIVQ